MHKTDFPPFFRPVYVVCGSFRCCSCGRETPVRCFADRPARRAVLALAWQAQAFFREKWGQFAFWGI